MYTQIFRKNILEYLPGLGQGKHRPSKSYEAPKFAQQSEKVIDMLIGGPLQSNVT